MPYEVLNRKPQNNKVDIFSLGLIFYYAYSYGKHPFGEEGYERYNNINYSKPPSLSYVNNNFLLKSLLNGMLSHSVSDRFDCSLVLRHPFFWDTTQKLQFLHQLHNSLSIPQNKSKFIHSLFRFKYSWTTVIDQKVKKNFALFYFFFKFNFFIFLKLLDHIEKQRKYKFGDKKEPLDLLRVIRNIYEHWFPYSRDFPEIFGENKEKLFYYFDSLFPDFLASMWERVKEIDYFSNINLKFV